MSHHASKLEQVKRYARKVIARNDECIAEPILRQFNEPQWMIDAVEQLTATESYPRLDAALRTIANDVFGKKFQGFAPQEVDRRLCYVGSLLLFTIKIDESMRRKFKDRYEPEQLIVTLADILTSINFELPSPSDYTFFSRRTSKF